MTSVKYPKASCGFDRSTSFRYERPLHPCGPLRCNRGAVVQSCDEIITFARNRSQLNTISRHLPHELFRTTTEFLKSCKHTFKKRYQKTTTYLLTARVLSRLFPSFCFVLPDSRCATITKWCPSHLTRVKTDSVTPLDYYHYAAY